MSKPKGDDQTPSDDRDFPPFADASGFPADDVVPGGDAEPLFFEESGGGSAEPTDDDIARMLQEMSGGEADSELGGTLSEEPFDEVSEDVLEPILVDDEEADIDNAGPDSNIAIMLDDDPLSDAESSGVLEPMLVDDEDDDLINAGPDSTLAAIVEDDSPSDAGSSGVLEPMLLDDEEGEAAHAGPDTNIIMMADEASPLDAEPSGVLHPMLIDDDDDIVNAGPESTIARMLDDDPLSDAEPSGVLDLMLVDDDEDKATHAGPDTNIIMMVDEVSPLDTEQSGILHPMLVDDDDDDIVNAGPDSNIVLMMDDDTPRGTESSGVLEPTRVHDEEDDITRALSDSSIILMMDDDAPHEPQSSGVLEAMLVDEVEDDITHAGPESNITMMVDDDSTHDAEPSGILPSMLDDDELADDIADTGPDSAVKMVVDDEDDFLEVMLGGDDDENVAHAGQDSNLTMVVDDIPHADEEPAEEALQPALIDDDDDFLEATLADDDDDDEVAHVGADSNVTLVEDDLTAAVEVAANEVLEPALVDDEDDFLEAMLADDDDDNIADAGPDSDLSMANDVEHSEVDEFSQTLPEGAFEEQPSEDVVKLAYEDEAEPVSDNPMLMEIVPQSEAEADASVAAIASASGLAVDGVTQFEAVDDVAAVDELETLPEGAFGEQPPPNQAEPTIDEGGPISHITPPIAVVVSQLDDDVPVTNMEAVDEFETLSEVAFEEHSPTNQAEPTPVEDDQAMLSESDLTAMVEDDDSSAEMIDENATLPEDDFLAAFSEDSAGSAEPVEAVESAEANGASTLFEVHDQPAEDDAYDATMADSAVLEEVEDDAFGGTMADSAILEVESDEDDAFGATMADGAIIDEEAEADAFGATMSDGAIIDEEAEDDAFGATMPDGALLEGDDDEFGKTMPEGAVLEIESENDDFDQTLPDGALAQANVDDDPFGKTMPAGALLDDDDGFAAKTMLVDDFDPESPAEDFGITLPVEVLERSRKVDKKVGTDVGIHAKTADGLNLSAADDLKTLALGDAVKKDGMRTSVAGTDAGPGVSSASSAKEGLNIALRSVSGMQYGIVPKVDYRLVKVLGEGGMGIVYVARQQSLGREVVFKTLKPMPAAQVDKLKTSGSLKSTVKHRTEMFLSEAVVTADLFHPNIVPIYDMGESPDGSLFYAMKWVRGVPWNKQLREMTLEENLDVLMKVADGIAFAHARHVINRDLKPENVMLGEFGEVAVLDWGLALPFGEGKNRLPLTVTAGLGSGTPAYMPPELITGPLDKIGPACDIYLLGAMLFECVTGDPPHEFAQMGTQSAARKMAEIRRVVCDNVIRETEITGELIDIARRAMAAKPADRYPTVVEFQQAIREYKRHAASRHLEARARELTDLAAEPTSADTDQNSPNYASYQNALTLFTESLREWSGNEEAREGLTETQLHLGELALRQGDYDLGLSVLDTNADSHSETRTKLHKARAERDGRVRRMKMLKITAVMLMIGFGLFAAVAARLQFNLKAVTKQAELAKEDAATATQEAATAKKDADAAVQEKAKAEEGKLLAEQGKVKAEKDLIVSRNELTKANEQVDAVKDDLKETDAKLEVAKKAEKAAMEKTEEAVVLAKKAGDDLVVSQTKLKDTETEFAVKKAEFAVKTDQFQKDLSVSEAQATKAKYLAGLAVANRFVQEGRYADARLKLQELKKNYADKCKDEWDQLWGTVNETQAVSLTKPVESIGLSRNGRLVAAGDNSGGIVILPLNEQGQIQSENPRRLEFGSRPRIVVMSPDGAVVAAAGDAGFIHVWSLADAEAEAKPPIVLKGHAGGVNTLKFSADGRRLVSGGDDRTIRMWSLNDARELAQQKVLYSARAVDWSRDGTILVAGTSTSDESAGVAYSWEVTTTDGGVSLKQLRTFQVPPEGKVKQGRGMVTIALTEDGQFAVCNGAAAEIHLWRVDLRKSGLNKKELSKVNAASMRLGLHSKRVERVRSLALTPDGSRLFAAGDDGTITVWDRRSTTDLPTYERKLVLYGHGGPVRGCFPLPQSPDLVISGSYDQHVHVWNLKTYPQSRDWIDHPTDANKTQASSQHLAEPSTLTRRASEVKRSFPSAVRHCHPQEFRDSISCGWQSRTADGKQRG